MRRIKGLLVTTTGLLALASGCADAQPRHLFSIPAEDLSDALTAFARQSGVAIVASPRLVGSHRSPGATGDLPPEEALGQLLAGTGFRAELIDGAFVIRRGERAKDADGSDIVVTGTRIRGAAPIGSPVTIIDRKAIDESGRTTLSDFIQTIPQNFGGGNTESTAGGNTIRNDASSNTGFGTSFNLRGLGSNSTLTLLDGNRAALGGYSASFSDISLIPTIAIDRIEILTDGASSLYGSDAVAGVVNLRFRNRFEGLEMRLSGGTADGSFGQEQASLIAGRSWASGGVVLAYQFDHRGRLPASDRAYATQNLSAYGGPDNRTGYALPATLIAADGTTYSATRVGTASNPLTTADLVAGAINKRDEARAIDLLPRQESHAVFASAHQDLFAGASLFARLLWARRRFDNAILPLDTAVSVPSTNPYYVDPLGTGEPISVERDFTAELGTPHDRGSVSGLDLSTGITGAVGAWHYELSGGLGRQHEITEETFPNTARIDAAAASSDPATALNPFGPDLPAVVAAIRGSDLFRTRYTVGTSALRLDGPLVRLPAGVIKLAIGAEYQHDLYHGVEIDDADYLTPTALRLDEPPEHRHITSQYAELAVPVLAARGFPGKLDLSLSGRIEEYSDVGTTRNPKVAGRWEPIRGVALRASWGTSFRAPNLLEKGSAYGSSIFAVYLPDPNSPTGESAVIDKSGYSKNIGPERATTWTAGIDLTPARVPGLTLSATYFHTDYRDRIDTAAYDIYSYLAEPQIYGSLIEAHPSASEVAAYFADPHFYNLSALTPDQIQYVTDGSIRNLSEDRISGVDMDAAYTHRLGHGTANANVSATRLLRYERVFTPGSAPTSELASYGYPVKLRLRGSLGWHDDRYDVTGAVNYTGGYHNTIFMPAPPVASWTTFDMQIGCTVGRAGPLGKAHIGLSATNLFNRKPPYIANVQVTSTVGYDAQEANAIGRVIALQGVFSW